jgi:DNA-binding response OmpR family regulator
MAATTGKKKVLIVDDEPSYRKLLRKLFERQGCVVETSASGLVAIELAREFTPDILIIDWMLKDSMDGLQIASELRKQNSELTTILITGYPSGDLEVKTRTEPRTTFVSKPFEAADVLSAVNIAAQENESG